MSSNLQSGRDPVDVAIRQLRGVGLIVDRLNIGPPPGGKKANRVDVDGQRRGKKNGWYICDWFRLDNGQQVIVGSYGVWVADDPGTVNLEFEVDKAVSAAERERLKADQARLAQQQQADVAELQAVAARRAADIWPKLPDHGSVPYLQRKQVLMHGCRIGRDGSLVVPLRRPFSDALVGLQFIQPDGSKRFITGTAKAGAAHLIGELPEDETGTIALAEGYATGASGHRATTWPVFVCFDCGNLLAVARAVREARPKARLVVLADHDQWTVRGEIRKAQLAGVDTKDIAGNDPRWAEWRAKGWLVNAGVLAAREILEVCTASVALPPIAADDPAKRSDWNDLHVSDGIDAVRAAILTPGSLITSWPAEPAVESGPAPTSDPTEADAPPADEAEAEPVAAAIGDLTHADLIARYELVHGKTDIWDTVLGQRMPYAAFAAQVGNEAAKAWKADTKKRVRIVVEKKAEKHKHKKPGTDPTVLDDLLKRYSLIYGTEAVFDHAEHMEITLGALRAFAGLKAVRDWTDHPRRRVVSLDDVQFAPQREVDDPQICNLWKGWSTLPREGTGGDAERVTRWLRVLHYVFGESDNVVDWVLKWMAYPLQYPGTKMTTSIILHGPEGSGKNTIADAVRRIYGRYGRSITQTQLESQWTDWISSKLFIVGNEVLHRQEQITQKGRIKTLITEPTVTVERKHLPGREEPNTANLIFLSNELAPLNIDRGDRRFLVMYTPPPHPDGLEFYQGLSEKSMPIETVQALHHYLLHKVDVTGFDAHTKPPMTEAKQRLIDISMPSDERFIRDWMAGETRLPYLPVTSELLFDAYDYWCRRNGEKYIRPSNKFKAAVMAVGVEASPGPIRYLSGTDHKQGRFFLPHLPDRITGSSMAARLGSCVDFFTSALKDWKNAQ